MTEPLRAPLERLIEAAASVTFDPEAVPPAESSAWQRLDIAIEEAREALSPTVVGNER